MYEEWETNLNSVGRGNCFPHFGHLTGSFRRVDCFAASSSDLEDDLSESSRCFLAVEGKFAADDMHVFGIRRVLWRGAGGSPKPGGCED